jgi:hypothetical protein
MASDSAFCRCQNLPLDINSAPPPQTNRNPKPHCAPTRALSEANTPNNNNNARFVRAVLYSIIDPFGVYCVQNMVYNIDMVGSGRRFWAPVSPPGSRSHKKCLGPRTLKTKKPYRAQGPTPNIISRVVYYSRVKVSYSAVPDAALHLALVLLFTDATGRCALQQVCWYNVLPASPLGLPSYPPSSHSASMYVCPLIL